MMPLNLCCLCCTPCPCEPNNLQNGSGDYNEVYEITVKFFDPMLLMENVSNDFTKESCVLCQNCWSHIQTFHNFYETIINKRNSLDQLIVQTSSVELKEDHGISHFTRDIYYIQNEDLKQLSLFSSENNLRNIVPSEEDLKILNEWGRDVDNQIDKFGKNIVSLNPCSEIGTERKDMKVNYVRKSHKSVVRKQKSSFRKNKNIHSSNCCDDQFTKNSDNHPLLDKGREYDKFIAEWKSQLECDVCNEAFPIFDLLKAHFKQKHNTKGFVKCCDRRFDRRCSLVEHIRLHINPEMHKCDLCGKVIGSKYSLIHHKKSIHEESKKFKCNKCPKMFKQKQNLKCHLLTHVAGNKDLKCKECDKAYVHEFQLKKHIKLVHVDNRVCDQCGKTLHGIGALKNHLKEHDNIEKIKFPCDECGAELGSRVTLKRHKASYHHDGTTVYVCGLCGKVSSTERALRNHKNFVHEKERKFKCPNCDKAFKRTQNLQEHIATHTGETLYQCPQCPKSFKISSKYHEHRKKAHPIEWEEGRKNRLEKQKIDFERVKKQVVL